MFFFTFAIYQTWNNILRVYVWCVLQHPNNGNNRENSWLSEFLAEACWFFLVVAASWFNNDKTLISHPIKRRHLCTLRLEWVPIICKLTLAINGRALISVLINWWWLMVEGMFQETNMCCMAYSFIQLK